MKRISDIGLKKLKEFEGLRKEAYLDAAGVPTIGYGHTHGVRMGDVISEYWAEMFPVSYTHLTLPTNREV